MNDRETLFCKCHNPGHQLIIDYSFIDGDEKEVYVYVKLAELPFFKKLKVVWNYLLNKRNNFGGFEEIILRSSDSDKLRKIADLLEES